MLFECLSYMSYMYTRKHHKRIVQSGGATPDGKIPFPLMTKGEIFIRCKSQRHGSMGNMSDMNLVLRQSVSINDKGGDCLIIGLVVIDVHP